MKETAFLEVVGGGLDVCDIEHTVIMVSTQQTNEVLLQSHPLTHPAKVLIGHLTTFRETNLEQGITVLILPDAPRAFPVGLQATCRKGISFFFHWYFGILSQAMKSENNFPVDSIQKMESMPIVERTS